MGTADDSRDCLDFFLRTRERRTGVQSSDRPQAVRVAVRVVVELTGRDPDVRPVGIGLAWFGVRELLAVAPANLPRLESVRIDPIVLAFTAAIALACAFVFGMVPAWGAFRLDVKGALQGSGRAAGLRGGRGLFRSAESSSRLRFASSC